jgi:hypothetical protein
MLTILGTLLGGLFRLAPELIKFLDRKEDRKHEQAMFDKNIAADTLRATANHKLEETRGANALNLSDMEALIEATKAQGRATGIPWVDAVTQTVRPFLTYWWAVVLYTAAMACEFYGLVWVSQQPAWSSMIQIFGPDEKAIAASMISFWFVDRVIMKARGR